MRFLLAVLWSLIPFLIIPAAAAGTAVAVSWLFLGWSFWPSLVAVVVLFFPLLLLYEFLGLAFLIPAAWKQQQAALHQRTAPSAGVEPVQPVTMTRSGPAPAIPGVDTLPCNFDPAGQNTAEGGRMPVRISIVEGPCRGQEHAFDQPATFLIGRSNEAHLQIEQDPFLSRNHALLEIAPPEVRIRDLGSMNGFTLNGVQFAGPAGRQPAEITLAHGDRLVLGDTVIVIAIEHEFQADSEEETLARPTGADGRPQPLIDIRDPALGGIPPDLEIEGVRIDSFLDKGGMGLVLQGTGTAGDLAGRTLAIKLLHPEGRRDPDILRKFNREIDLTARLSHPNVVTCLGRGRSGPYLYLLMEFVDGMALDRFMTQEGGRVDWDTARPLVRDMLAGMAYAHHEGFIHRDIKPANVLLARLSGGGWQAKIADLGLAKSYLEAGMSNLTSTGFIGGTCMFMPPEQVTRFKYLKPVSDVFSIGATLYNLLSGFSVYDMASGTDPIEIILAGRTVPLADRGVDLPANLVALIDRAISVKPEQRWPDAVAMQADFLPLLEG